MSEISRRILASCLTMVIVIFLFVSLLLIVGAGLVLYGSQLGSL